MAYSTQGNGPVRIVSKVRIVLCSLRFIFSDLIEYVQMFCLFYVTNVRLWKVLLKLFNVTLLYMSQN